MGALSGARERIENSCQRDAAAVKKTSTILKKTSSITSLTSAIVQKEVHEIEKAVATMSLTKECVDQDLEMVEATLRKEIGTLKKYEMIVESGRADLAEGEKKLAVCREQHEASVNQLCEERHRLMLFLGLVAGMSPEGATLKFKFIDRQDPQREFGFVFRHNRITKISPPVSGVDEITNRLKDKRITLVEAICLMRAAFRKSVEKC